MELPLFSMMCHITSIIIELPVRIFIERVCVSESVCSSNTCPDYLSVVEFRFELIKRYADLFRSTPSVDSV